MSERNGNSQVLTKQVLPVGIMVLSKILSCETVRLTWCVTNFLPASEI